MSDFLVFIQPIAYAGMACWAVHNDHNALAIVLLVAVFSTSMVRKYR